MALLKGRDRTAHEKSAEWTMVPTGAGKILDKKPPFRRGHGSRLDRTLWSRGHL
jgi:hypothetical protein